jgi:hypothetical protein
MLNQIRWKTKLIYLTIMKKLIYLSIFFLLFSCGTKPPPNPAPDSIISDDCVYKRLNFQKYSRNSNYDAILSIKDSLVAKLNEDVSAAAKGELSNSFGLFLKNQRDGNIEASYDIGSDDFIKFNGLKAFLCNEEKKVREGFYITAEERKNALLEISKAKQSFIKALTELGKKKED